MTAKSFLSKALLTTAITLAASSSFAAATIKFLYVSNPGEGFYDTTPAAPVGGNPGTTLGEQRRNVFETVGQIWAAKLNTTQQIDVIALFTPLACTATGAVLGSAGPTSVYRDFPGAEKPNTWYHSALANKIARTDLMPGMDEIDSYDVFARFNSNLGQPGCLTGSGFYLGVDGNSPPGLINLASVFLHEMGHGLGFSNATDNRTTGEYFDGSPALWDYFIYDQVTKKRWVQMTPAERLDSRVRPRRVTWRGDKVNEEVQRVLQQGTPVLTVRGSITDTLLSGPANFGPLPTENRMSGDLVDTASNGCAAFPATLNLNRKVALIDRGTCAFTVKVKNAQLAGASAVLIADNVAGGPPPNLAGADATIVIPSVRISKEDGIRLRTALTTGPVNAGLSTNFSIYAGASTNDDMLLYTPIPFAPGSSVSHFDTSATTKTKRDVLMEPFIGTQGLFVDSPNDLTYPLFKDLGW
jgi:PA domain